MRVEMRDEEIATVRRILRLSPEEPCPKPFAKAWFKVKLMWDRVYQGRIMDPGTLMMIAMVSNVFPDQDEDPDEQEDDRHLGGDTGKQPAGKAGKADPKAKTEKAAGVA